MRLLLCVVLVAAVASSARAVQCLNEHGAPVDWFVALKLPGLDSSDSCAKQGSCYVYGDSTTGRVDWTGKTLAGNPNGAIGATMQQMHHNHGSSSVAYGMYNDQPPEGHKESSKFGHCKGNFAFDSHSGYWILHSLPHFPVETSKSYGFPDSGLIYGQSFICVSLPASAFDNVGKQLQYYRPNFYDANMPSSLAGIAPALKAAMDGEYQHSASNHVSFRSLGGFAFEHFAKSAACQCDMWETLIEDHYNADMAVETWRRSGEPSYCAPQHPHNSLNVAAISLPWHGAEWKYTKDHSKWGVTTSNGKTIVCIGGINRMASQKKRGGGAMCFDHKGMHEFFHSIQENTEPCDGGIVLPDDALLIAA